MVSDNMVGTNKKQIRFTLHILCMYVLDILSLKDHPLTHCPRRLRRRRLVFRCALFGIGSAARASVSPVLTAGGGGMASSSGGFSGCSAGCAPAPRSPRPWPR